MKKMIIGNWKMNGQPAMAEALTLAVLEKAAECDKAKVVICPPAPLIALTLALTKDRVVSVGGQDCHASANGAFTGDTSADLLKDIGCEYVIVGHSERRAMHKESNHDVQAKASRAILSGLTPIICIGETLEQRESGQAEEVVGQQVKDSIPDESLASNAPNPNFLLAYEPVWAIGSGKTPTIDDIVQMHTHIISVAAQRTGHKAEHMAVLYGGSVKAANAQNIMASQVVSGVLVGGASLKAEEFCSIIAAA